jgi:hypothetical protein
MPAMEMRAVIGHLLLRLADLAAGVIALAWPAPTALVLVLIVGAWAVVAGLVEIAAAFGTGEQEGSSLESSGRSRTPRFRHQVAESSSEVRCRFRCTMCITRWWSLAGCGSAR